MATISTRPVYREIPSMSVSMHERDPARRLIVGILPNGLISIRLKGTRHAYEVSAYHALSMAMSMEKRAEKKRRKAARDKRRLERELAIAFGKPHPQINAL